MAASNEDAESCPGKIFVGGLSRDTTEAFFTNYFGKYGTITDSVIMKDRVTKAPRGFGFITYEDPSVVDEVIKLEHVIHGKQVEIKRTIPRSSNPSKGLKTKKIFVGGIPTSISEEEFKLYFAKFGKVSEHQIMQDHATGRSRGFGFITFESEDSVETILSKGRMHELGGKQVEIKKAEPKKTSDSESPFVMDTRKPFLPRGLRGFGDFKGYGGSGADAYGNSYRPGPYGARQETFGPYGGAEFGSSHAGYVAGVVGGYRGEYSTGYGGGRFGPYGGGFGNYGGGSIGGYEDEDSLGGYGGSSYSGGYDSGNGRGSSYGSARGYGVSSTARYHPYAR